MAMEIKILGICGSPIKQGNTEVFLDATLKVAKEMSKSPRQCVVLAGTMESCKSALSAGMQCVALPDRFTAFQDFSGAQEVLESQEDLDPQELGEVLFPAEG